MKKKSLLIVLLIVFVGLFNFANFGRAFYVNLIEFTTDKELYYNDETIEINATWDLDYNPSLEISYVQIHISDINETLIWNSSKYYEIGVNNDIWLVSIQDLDSTFDNYTSVLYIKFFYYVMEISSGSAWSIFLQTIEIETIKRNVSCELIDFTDTIIYGEDLYFKAIFYNTSLNNNSVLINQLISFKIISNEIILCKNNYTTNSSGEIGVFISSLGNLSINLNYLIFTISDNKNFRDSDFTFEIFVRALHSQKSNKSKKSNKKNDDTQLMIISLVSIICLVCAVAFLMRYNSIRKVRARPLVDISFRY